MPTFLQYPKVHQVESGDSPYADARNHCERYSYYSVAGQRVTSTHECTHGINSQLRNKPIRMSPTPSMSMGEDAIISCSLPQPAEELTPEEEDRKMMITGNMAGFYLLQDKAIMLENPSGTISAAAKLVPANARYSRYNLYMVKQAASWNNEPLYIFDEWVAYRNGAACLIYDATHGGSQDSNSDFIFGPLEFCTYGLAIMKMASDSGPIGDELRDFTHWLLMDSFNLYFTGKVFAPWAQADTLYNQFKSDPGFQQLRQFASDSLSFQIPDGIVTPSDTLDWIM
jgi:hypothetical protein